MCFTVSGMVCGVVSSFVIMRRVAERKKSRIDLYLKVFACLGYLSILFLMTLSLVSSQSFLLYCLALSLCGVGFNSFVPSACQSLV